MKFVTKIEISESEYNEKRYDIAKSILANVVTQENYDSFTEDKSQASLIFKCISLSDALLKELGYFYEEEKFINIGKKKDS